MKFEEKLIYLRKKSLLSQEGLADKLNVTRQTVSKWELGQTKPDMDKLVEMSKLFNVSVDVLTNDNLSIEESKEKVKQIKKNNNEGGRKFILYILIIIFIASVVTLSYRIASSIKERNDAIKEEMKKEKEAMENEIKNQQESVQKQMEESKNQIAKEKFNGDYEFWSGSQTSTPVSNIIDSAVANNKKNTEHLIEFIFDGTSYGTSPESIKTIKSNLRDFEGYNIQYYEVSLDYDNDGYVNKVTIETR